MAAPLPPNVHQSMHPCLLAKLSKLRAESSSAEVKGLVHDVSLIIGVEALAHALKAVPGAKGVTSPGFDYITTGIQPGSVCLVPILRSGLGMVDAIQTILPQDVRIHHLGIYREPATLAPVEYYNNLPNETTATGNAAAADLAIVVDPIIATGGTCVAAIQTLREWGARRVLVLSILGNTDGVRRCAEEWPEGVDIWVAGLDADITPTGMLKPGVGDIGDRLFLTLAR